MTALIKPVTKEEVKASMETKDLNSLIEEINRLLMERGELEYYFKVGDSRAKIMAGYFRGAGWTTRVEVKNTSDPVCSESAQMLYIS